MEEDRVVSSTRGSISKVDRDEVIVAARSYLPMTIEQNSNEERTVEKFFFAVCRIGAQTAQIMRALSFKCNADEITCVLGTRDLSGALRKHRRARDRLIGAGATRRQIQRRIT
jgi:hypothetical protein